MNKQEMKQKGSKLKIIQAHKEGVLPLACLMNLRSASLRAESELSPVQSKEWEDPQSASAHDMLQVLTTPSEEITSYFERKRMMCSSARTDIHYPSNHMKLQLRTRFYLFLFFNLIDLGKCM